MNYLNPFELEENLTPWFEKDNQYRASKNSAFKKYVRKRQKKSGLEGMFHSVNSDLAILLFKNASIVAAAFIVTIFTGMSAAAAEIVAPEQYKPSNLIRLSQVEPEDTRQLTNDDIENGLLNNVEKYEPKPLVPDENNDVLVLDECNLAIKYNKKSLDAVTSSNIYSSRYWQRIENIQLKEVGKDSTQSMSGTNYISCHERVNQTDDLNETLQEDQDLMLENKEKIDAYEVVFLSPATQSTLGEVYKVRQNFASGPRELIVFEHRKIVYFLEIDQNNPDITLQINSLAPSTSTTTVE
jgi:hypothetical protein